MNAMKRRNRESKRERDDSDLISQTVVNTMSLVCKSIALSLHELYGFGEKRVGAVLQDAVNRVDEYTDRYGSEFVETAMDEHLDDIGMDITVKGR